MSLMQRTYPSHAALKEGVEKKMCILDKNVNSEHQVQEVPKGGMPGQSILCSNSAGSADCVRYDGDHSCNDVSYRMVHV